jgi:geranylgeranyl reductase family protein
MPDAAIRDEAEVVVVGAGPSGCTAAATLAELGHEVLLIDKDEFPREKPCGDGLLHPAIAAAERLGLSETIESGLAIESTRMVIGHRRQIQANSFAPAPGKPIPRCITRKKFDAALLAAALERGARLVQGRVDSLEPDGSDQLLQAVAGEESFGLKAGMVIAADGATSRLRRIAKNRAERPYAYGIRRYFRTERPLDPAFQIDMPIEVDGRVLAGYGWVFPIDEHTANIGVGIICEPHRRIPSMRRVLGVYVSELEAKAGRRLGDLDPIGEPIGSPMGIRPQIEVADSSGLALVGDAAGTTHPITGEGIAFAMRGAEALARAVHDRSKRGAGAGARSSAEDAAIWHAFPQIGVDTSALIRVSVFAANSTPKASEDASSTGEPFLASAWKVTHDSAYETELERTPAWNALAECDPQLGANLSRTNDLLLARLADPMPFVTEVIHDSIKAHHGPMYAAVAVAVAAAGAPAEASQEAGVAAETVGILPKLFTMLLDRARSKQVKINNALSVLTGDFAATRALTAAAKLGPEAVAALSRACQAGCEGSMRDAITRFDAFRDPGDWLAAAQETEGRAMVLATELGAMARGDDPAVPEPLRQAGAELGVAMRMAEEIVEFAADDVTKWGQAGTALERGIYTLPLLYAAEADPSLPRLLARHTAERLYSAEISAIVNESGALARTVAECGERAEAARSLAEAWGGEGSVALAALAALPADYVASSVSGDALASA